MHLLPADPAAVGPDPSWTEKILAVIDAGAIGVLSDIFNDRFWDSGWRVSLDGLHEGDAWIVCSVLYWPQAEFDLTLLGQPPLPKYWEDLQHQIEQVEADLRRLDPAGQRVIVARKAQDFEHKDKRIVFVHCVEGGFHLGSDPTELYAKVGLLAEQGVIYITLAHLFYREVATNAPAIPFLTDAQYNEVFHQPNAGLTALGVAAVRAMYDHKVLIDISHMSEEAIDATFKLVEKLDADSGADKLDFPLIATHVGMRDAGPDAQAYNLSEVTARRIHERGGLIGLIMAQHQLGQTADANASRALINKHLDAIKQACGDHSASAFGTDLDGFIRPTIEGVQQASDLSVLAQWIVNDQPNDAQAILYGNAQRVFKRVFEAR
jgi:microsomal dipeptidase-like Zn-dependent dipeptidase